MGLNLGGRAPGRTLGRAMVPGLAFLATAVSTVFAQATLVRFTQRRKPHELAWTVALAMFALASVALASGSSTGWDRGTFRFFYLMGAILDVPWLALGTVYLLASPAVGRRVQWFLVGFSGFAAGVMLTAPMRAVAGDTIPVGKDVFDALPRILAAAGSGAGALVVFAGATWSVVRFLRHRERPGSRRMAGANALIALGTAVLSAGGLVEGVVGHDEAFALSLALGISVIYVGFLTAGARSRAERQASTPAAATSAAGAARVVSS
jgi:hypothetical protein